MTDFIQYGAIGLLGMFIALHFKYLVNDRHEESNTRKETNEVLRNLTEAIHESTTTAKISQQIMQDIKEHFQGRRAR